LVVTKNNKLPHLASAENRSHRKFGSAIKVDLG